MLYANVGPNGIIVFEPHADPGLGRLPVGIASNKDARRMREIVSTYARHAYDGTTLLVPRMPEARTPDQAMDALLWFKSLIEMRMKGENGWPEVPESLRSFP